MTQMFCRTAHWHEASAPSRTEALSGRTYVVYNRIRARYPRGDRLGNSSLGRAALPSLDKDACSGLRLHGGLMDRVPDRDDQPDAHGVGATNQRLVERMRD